MTTLLRFLGRAWFPLALAGLVLVAVPVFCLFLLSVLGEAGPINAWLEEHFQLSYQLAVPGWLGPLLLALPLLLILLYFLKLKRKSLQVPSTFLWKKSIEDLHVNSLFQWLRQNLLLLLQLMALLLFVYALMGFRFHGSTSVGKHYILLIDNSASMSAKDVTPSRLDFAKQEALKEIDAASDGDVGMVIVFNSKATTLQTYTNHRAKLRAAVQSIEPSNRTTRIEEALALADSLANPVRSTEDAATQPTDVPAGQERTFVPPQGIPTTVHLFSDGRFPELSESALANLNSRLAGNTSALGNLNVRYHRAGQLGPGLPDNLGIVALNAVRWGGDAGKEQDVQRLQVLVRVRNYRPASSAPARVLLRLDAQVDGKLTHPEQKLLQIPPRTVIKDDTGETEEGGEVTATFILPPLDLRRNTVLHAYLENPGDAFALDDQAWLCLGAVRKARVLQVGPPNPILDAFFDQEATRRIARVERLKPADLQEDTYRKIARSGEADLVIFDRCAPESEAEMPLANTLFIDRPPPPWNKGDQVLKNPFLLVARRDHPLLQHLTTLWDVGVSEAFRFDPVGNLPADLRKLAELPDGDPRKRSLPPVTRLIETRGQTPILFTVPRGPFTDLVMTFPLIDARGDLATNWPLQTSFPLFLRNLLYQLGKVRDTVREETAQPGEPLTLRPEAGVQWLKVTDPAGAVHTVKRESGPEFTFADTENLGVYRVLRDDGQERSFAVNLLDPLESNVGPNAEVRFGGEQIEADQERVQPREIWKWILLLAVLLLMVEWVVYNRRIFL